MKAQTKDAGNVYTVYWKNFECELCKNAYPFIFRVKDRLYKLVDMRQPQSPNYIVMESVPLERNASRTVHMLVFTDT
jgi:hypothetical protein